MLASAEQYEYDADGRLTKETSRERLPTMEDGELVWIRMVANHQDADDNAWLAAEYTDVEGKLELITRQTDHSYDAAGRAFQYSSGLFTYTVQSRRDGRIENGVFVQGDPAHPENPKPNFQFVNASGQQLAQLREGGEVTLAATKQQAASTRTEDTMLAVAGTSPYAAGGGKVLVQEGDTLSSLAQRVYGNSGLWYVLAQANGLSDPDGPLTAGTALNAPSVSVNKNDAGTFRPYNPAEAIGPTSPELPFIDPPKQGCNVLATLIVVAVALVVTAYTAGLATPGVLASGGATFGTIVGAGSATLAGAGGLGLAVTAGAIGGFAGSIASQVVGKALGVTDHFSLRQAVGAGITGGLSAGIATTLGGTATQLSRAGNLSRVAGSGALNNLASVVGNRIAGVPNTAFSWSAVAAGAVSATISSKLTQGMTRGGLGNETLLGDTAHTLTNSVVSLHTRRQFGLNDRIDYGNLAADAFGNAIGNALTGELEKRSRFDTASAAQAFDAQFAQLQIAGVGNGQGRGGFGVLDDQTHRQSLIADDEAQLLSLNSGIGTAGNSRLAPDVEEIILDAGQGMGRPATTSTYLRALVDPHEIARNGGNSNYVGVTTTYGLGIDAAPASVTLLPEDRSPIPSIAQNSSLDQVLLGAISLANDLRGVSRRNIDTSNSRAMAGFNSLVYAVNSVTSAAVEGAANFGRIFTNDQQRSQFLNGVGTLLTTDPRITATAAVNQFSSLSTEDKQIQLAAFLATMGIGPATKVTAMADVAADASTIGKVLIATERTSAIKSLRGTLADLSPADRALIDSVEAFGPNNARLPEIEVANSGGPQVLFGQKRVGPAFGFEGRPSYLAGREISAVANDLRAGVLHPDQLPIDAFYYNGQLVSANTRSLAALSEAGLQPTSVSIIQPSRQLLLRLRETPLLPNAPLPGPRVPVTPSQSDLVIFRVIEVPGVR